MSVKQTVDLHKIAAQAAEIRNRCGVAMIAVVKADAYGLGASPIATTLADIVDGFCVFSLQEAISANLWEIGRKPILALRSAPDITAEMYLENHVRPAVSTVAEARRLKAARPVLCVDCGMQRFAASPAEIDAILSAGECDEAFTHAIDLQQVKQFENLMSGRGLRLHAAGSSLLNEPSARFDAVRPGIALYRGMIKVETPLVEVRDSGKPAGYSGFTVARLGIILCGYSHGLRRGPCIINGQRRQIMEVGMQSSYVEIGPGDSAGDSVVLLGEGISEAEIAKAWGISEHEALVRLSRL
jgi:alanine racemase